MCLPTGRHLGSARPFLWGRLAVVFFLARPPVAAFFLRRLPLLRRLYWPSSFAPCAPQCDARSPRMIAEAKEPLAETAAAMTGQVAMRSPPNVFHFLAEKKGHSAIIADCVNGSWRIYSEFLKSGPRLRALKIGSRMWTRTRCGKSGRATRSEDMRCQTATGQQGLCGMKKRSITLSLGSLKAAALCFMLWRSYAPTASANRAKTT